MEFRDRVKRLRDDSGMTQAQLAERLGITNRAVGAWESGRSKPRIDKLQELADLFGVSPHWLLDGDTSADHPALSPDESELIACYRSTDERGREAILDTARRERGATGSVQGAVAAGA